jgi:hypothetical protein
MFTYCDRPDQGEGTGLQKNWFYACHESKIANNHALMTVRADRQPLIIPSTAKASSTPGLTPACTAVPP